MKLHFTKDQDTNQVFIISKGIDMEFSYVEMIRRLYKERNIEESVFTGNFSDEEKSCITDLVQEINLKINEVTEPAGTDGFMAIPF